VIKYRQKRGTAARSFFEQFWDDANRSHQERHTFLDFQIDCHSYLLNQCGPLQGKRVLLIGPGRGLDLDWLAPAGAQVVAFDIAQSSLTLCRKRAPQVGPRLGFQLTCIQGDAHQLPFADATFDICIVKGVMVHTLPSMVGNECARVTRSGGRMVIQESLRYHPLVSLHRFFDVHRVLGPRFITLGTIDLVGESFHSYHHREFYLFSVLGLVIRRQGTLGWKIVRLLQTIDSRLLSRCSFLRRFAWVSVATFYQGRAPAAEPKAPEPSAP
jgi:SAM-dependent methyltransferase